MYVCICINLCIYISNKSCSSLLWNRSKTAAMKQDKSIAMATAKLATDRHEIACRRPFEWPYRIFLILHDTMRDGIKVMIGHFYR